MLEAIRDLMNTDCVVPDWIHDIFLGYGDPAAAHYTRLVLVRLLFIRGVVFRIPQQIKSLDFNDTFLSLDHLRDSFPQYQIKVIHVTLTTTLISLSLSFL